MMWMKSTASCGSAAKDFVDVSVVGKKDSMLMGTMRRTETRMTELNRMWHMAEHWVPTGINMPPEQRLDSERPLLGAAWS